MNIGYFLKSKSSEKNSKLKVIGNILYKLPKHLSSGLGKILSYTWKKQQKFEFDANSFEDLSKDSHYDSSDFNAETERDFAGFDNQAYALNQPLEQEKKENNLKLSSERKDEIESNSVNLEQINPKTINYPEYDPKQSILTPLSRCCICKQYISSVAFLCDHNYCENCLADVCCNQILQYAYEADTSGAEERGKFMYRCGADGCLKNISVPTRKVVKFWLDNKLKFDTQGFKEYFLVVLNNHVPFFDGVSC